MRPGEGIRLHYRRKRARRRKRVVPDLVEFLSRVS
jgi:hypothetical protein